MAHLNLTGFGEELKTIHYKDNLDWFVRYIDVYELWRAQPTYMISQIVFILGSLLTLIHALKKGGRWPWLWLATILHGIVVETMAYNLPEIDNFWHSQTPVVFLGGRFPIHIVLLYVSDRVAASIIREVLIDAAMRFVTSISKTNPTWHNNPEDITTDIPTGRGNLFKYSVFIYHASYAVSRLQLPSWAEPFAVGLTVVLIDIPYDIVAVKFVHWTWHDTDPNIEHRHYWVPWNSYYFHSTFAASFTFWFHITHKLFTYKIQKWKYSGFFKEFASMTITGLLGMPGGVCMFLPIYHPLHDFGGLHSEVTFFIILSIFLTIAWSGDRTVRKTVKLSVDIFDWTLILNLISHYGIYLGFTIWAYPENEVSIGYHEVIGPCENQVSMRTAFGTVMRKREFLCVEDYDEDYFDFSCLPNGKTPKHGSSWYTICGTPFRNRCEYIAILCTICLTAFVVFYNYYFRTVDMNNDKSEAKKKFKVK